MTHSKHFLARAEDPDLVQSDVENAHFTSAAGARQAQCILLYVREKAVNQELWLERISSLEVFISILGLVATVVDVR
jgi:hypothetical protein